MGALGLVAPLLASGAALRCSSAAADPPVAERRWLWRGAEQLGTLQNRVQQYLTELTVNGQWVWDECAHQTPPFVCSQRFDA